MNIFIGVILGIILVKFWGHFTRPWNDNEINKIENADMWPWQVVLYKKDWLRRRYVYIGSLVMSDGATDFWLTSQFRGTKFRENVDNTLTMFYYILGKAKTYPSAMRVAEYFRTLGFHTVFFQNEMAQGVRGKEKP